MTKRKRVTTLFLAFVFVWVLAFAGMALLHVEKAQALEDMPRVTEADLSSGKINSKNWMSGISGALRLHEISIPGTHDSGMTNVSLRTQVSGFIPILNIAPEVGRLYARTQDLGIDEQLNAGVRMFDIRITDTKPDGAPSTKGDGGLWVCHGPNAAKRFMSFTYYSTVPKNKRTNDEPYLTFDKVMRYCTDFLREHPTETVIVQVDDESGAGEKSTTWQRANTITEKWANTINPSTGKSYVYKQPNSGNDWHITTMPKLEDTRGQIVFAASSASCNYGMNLYTGNTWTTGGHVADVGLSYENHYECSRKEKADYVQAFYGGYPTEKGERMPAQETDIRGRLPYNVSNAIFVNASSNGFKTANGTPGWIADYVNEILFTGDDPFFGDTRGTHVGWLNVDFVTAQIAKKIWMCNYPKGGFEYSKLTFKPGSGEGAEKSYTVQRGTDVRLPQSMFAVLKNSGLEFLGWDVEGMTQYGPQQPGRSFTADSSTYAITAQYIQSWRSIAQLINDARRGEKLTITLKNDITATKLDTALSIAKGKDIVINLNGHTIDRNDSTRASVGSGSQEGSAIITAGTLTINGPGTIKGGSAVRGGGINIASGSVTLNNVTIQDNYASRAGGGVYVRSDRCSLTVSGSTRIEGNGRIGGGNSNVYLGFGTMNAEESAVIKGIDTLSEGITIGVSCEREPQPASPTPITERLGTDAAQAKNLLAHLESECDYGIELGANNQAVFTRAHKVTFNTMGGGEVKTQFRKTGEKVVEPAKPEKTGASFMGWYDAETDEKYDFNTPVTRNINLVASWNESVHKVTFDSTFGSPVDSQLIAYGKFAIEPETPVREGYDFTGWRINIGDRHGINYVPYHFDEPVIKDITLKAGWSLKKFTITFINEGSEYAKQTVDYGNKATRPANPTSEGFWFDGWWVEGATGPYNFDYTPDQNLKLVAHWKQIPSYKVSFQPHGDNVMNVPADQTVKHGEKATAPISAPTREGYSFKGWHRSALYGGGVYDFNQPVLGEVNLYAQWEATTHTVSFDGNAGGDAVTNLPATQSVKHDEIATKPQYEPRRAGHYFTGWKLGDSPYSFGEKVTSDITLKAQWGIIRYTLFFRPNAAGVTGMPANAEEDFGKTWAKPADPVRPGYVFGGWYTDAACTEGNEFDFSAPIAHSREVFAKWTRASYTVSFYGNAGEDAVTNLPATQTVEHGARVDKPDVNPTRSGYVFTGWYAGDAPYDFKQVVTDKVELTAHWQEVQPDKFVVVFDSDGGSEVDAQLVDKDGNAVRPASDPTRAGYTFEGWFTYEGYSGTDAYNFSTPVTGDLVLYAKWTPVQHRVTFKDSGDVVEEQTVYHDSVAIEPESPTKAESVFAGWFADGKLYDFSAPVTGDLTLTAEWEPIPYEVTFDSNGGSAVDSQFVYKNGKVVRPDDPTRDGFAFVGWYAGDDLYDFNTAVASDLELTAHWVKLSWLVEFNDPVGGFEYDAQLVDDGNKALQPTPVPELEGYVFDGWYLGDSQNPYDFDTPVKDHLSLEAKWTRVTYEVTFDSAGGTGVEKQVVGHGDKVAKPADPQKDHCSFGGWYADGDPFDFAKPITGAVALTAQWIPEPHAVTFDANGGAPNPANQNVAYGAHATEPAAPVLTGSTFDGWYVDVAVDKPITAEEAAAIENDPALNPWIWVVDDGSGNYSLRIEHVFGDDAITQNTVLHARWIGNTHAVSFDANGGSRAPAIQSVEHGQMAIEPGVDPEREGHVFTGWYTDAACSDDKYFDFEMAITGDLVLYAGWVEAGQASKHTVSFNLNGGTGSIAEQEVDFGSTVTAPTTAPTKEHYSFTGWYTDQACTEGSSFAFTTRITSDTVLYAGWMPEEYVVMFATGVDDAPDDQLVAYNGTATRPVDPVCVGYTFKGWYADAQLTAAFDFGAPITDDTVVYAKWEANKHTVTFDANGGAPVPDQQQCAYGETATKPATDPVKEGSTFEGWYVQNSDEAIDDVTAKTIRDDAELSRTYWITDDNRLRALYDFEYLVEGDITLYARWQLNVNTVSFVDDSGSVINEQKVLSGDTPTEIDGASDGRYTFEGWFADEARSAKFDFGRPVNADTTVYGKWAEQTYTVSFDSNGGSAVTPQVQQVTYEGFVQKPDDPKRDGFVFLGWFEDVSDKMTPDDLATMRAELVEYLETAEGGAQSDESMSAQSDEDVAAESAVDVEAVLKAFDEQVQVIDGKVMVKYNPETDPVYANMTVQAQWGEEAVDPEVTPTDPDDPDDPSSDKPASKDDEQAGKDSQPKQQDASTKATTAKGAATKTGDGLIPLMALFASLCVVAAGALSFAARNRE